MLRKQATLLFIGFQVMTQGILAGVWVQTLDDWFWKSNTCWIHFSFWKTALADKIDMESL